MELQEKTVREFQEIFKKEYGKELTYEEAAESARNLLGLLDVMRDIHLAELKLKERLKESPKGFSIMDGATYSCGICHTSIKDEQLWYDKWGKKCLACQDAVNKRKIPGSICYNNKNWYSTWDLEHYFKLKAPTVRKLTRDGVLKARVVPKSNFLVFMVKDNKDTLPPKEPLKSISVPVEGKEGTFSVKQWYEVYDPEKALEKFKIWPYLTKLAEESRVV